MYISYLYLRCMFWSNLSSLHIKSESPILGDTFLPLHIEKIAKFHYFEIIYLFLVFIVLNN